MTKLRFLHTLQRLNNISPKLEKELCEAALLSENKTKNRNAEICPSKSPENCSYNVAGSQVISGN